MTSFPEPPPDQVERLQAFLVAHPGITVKLPASPDGPWAAYRDGVVICCERELKALLDRVEWILANEGEYLP
jgi:hypothetical protein